MLDKLPEFIDPINSVNHNKQFMGRVKQCCLKRLSEVARPGNREIKVDLSFFFDKALKFPAFIMKLDTVLELQCQRSLEMFEYPIQSEVKGIFVESLRLAEDVPSEVEVFELVEDKIPFFDWIEEELLLSIPLAPVDPSKSMRYDNKMDQKEVMERDSKQPNPFAALQTLKQ